MSEASSAPFSLKSTFYICTAIFLVGLLLTQVIFSTEPEAKREAATKRTAMLVEVVTAERGDFQPQIIAMGAVVPAERVLLRAQVGGQITHRAEGFSPGGFIKKGDALLTIDPADYGHQLQQREGELAQAQASLAIEAGEQAAARRDYERLNRELSGMQQELILRKPQMRSARAKVTGAEAVLAQARLDLERTQVRAPFDAQVVSRNVELGSNVDTNDTLAELVGLNSYWVEASLPLAKLPWLQLPNTEHEGSKVSLRHRTAWPAGASRIGHLKSVIGSLEGATRMARAIIEVQDPLARQKQNTGAAQLFAGSYVECVIAARPLVDVVKLARRYVRKNNTAWLMENNKLVIRELDIVFEDNSFAYVQSGILAGDKIVITDLSRVRNGAELRLKPVEGSNVEAANAMETGS